MKKKKKEAYHHFLRFIFGKWGWTDPVASVSTFLSHYYNVFTQRVRLSVPLKEMVVKKFFKLMFLQILVWCLASPPGAPLNLPPKTSSWTRWPEAYRSIFHKQTHGNGYSKWLIVILASPHQFVIGRRSSQKMTAKLQNCKKAGQIAALTSDLERGGSCSSSSPSLMLRQ